MTTGGRKDDEQLIARRSSTLLVRGRRCLAGPIVGRLGRAGVGAASDRRERSSFEPLTRGKCLNGAFRRREGYRERPCPPRTSEAGASVAKWRPTQDEALPGTACRAPRMRHLTE